MAENPLTLADIADLRAYERERDRFRAEVIELKRRRRVSVGPIVTFVFENRTTVRFQIQEMARAERMLTDAAIEAELAVYNALLPGNGELSATLFLELADRSALEEWLPALVGIERSVVLRIGDASSGLAVSAVPEAAHAAQLTREDVTASVHYVRFPVGADSADRLRDGPVVLAVEHPRYRYETLLSAETRAELASDLA